MRAMCQASPGNILELDELLLSTTSQPILNPPLIASLRIKLDKMNKVTLDPTQDLFLPIIL